MYVVIQIFLPFILKIKTVRSFYLELDLHLTLKWPQLWSDNLSWSDDDHELYLRKQKIMRHSDLKHMRGGYKITLENIFKSVTITLD